MSLVNITKVLKIDNLINETLYQDNKDFSQFETKHKILAIYYPQNYTNRKNWLKEIYNESEIQKNEEINSKSLIEQQIKLAKNHGIFGFGIVYNLINGIIFSQKILNFFLNDHLNNFPFFIILNCDYEYNQNNQSSLIQNITYPQRELINLIDIMEEYLKSENYIKFRGKPLLGIFNSFLTEKLIGHFRNYETEKKNGKVHILTICSGNEKPENSKSNSLIEFVSQDLGLEHNLQQKYFYNFYYPNLIKEEYNHTKNIRNFFIINGSLPNKFYLIFRKFLNLTDPDNSQFILFNSWNNYKESSFLEPDENYGFSYLNSFSKAIFNLNTEISYDLNELNNKSKIAVQIHLFYKDLINDVINKTNNIPVKFDLYISITSPEIQKDLEKYINNFSRSNYYEILIVENKGRDILPFLRQMKNKLRLYKYLCHIHTKKSLTAPEIGILWRNYLYDNLLGSVNTVSEILFDFEINPKLGFLFPETFYKIIKQFYLLTDRTKGWMDFLASKLFPGYKIGELSNFPAGNMFWAKVEAISQIFGYNFDIYFPNEDDQTNNTIMHGIERIWLYLVKFNKFYYKEILSVKIFLINKNYSEF